MQLKFKIYLCVRRPLHSTVLILTYRNEILKVVIPLKEVVSNIQMTTDLTPYKKEYVGRLGLTSD